MYWLLYFFFQAEDGIRDLTVTGVQTCALPISGKACVEGAQEAVEGGGCLIVFAPAGGVLFEAGSRPGSRMSATLRFAAGNLRSGGRCAPPGGLVSLFFKTSFISSGPPYRRSGESRGWKGGGSRWGPA